MAIQPDEILWSRHWRGIWHAMGYTGWISRAACGTSSTGFWPLPAVPHAQATGPKCRACLTALRAAEFSDEGIDRMNRRLAREAATVSADGTL